MFVLPVGHAGLPPADLAALLPSCRKYAWGDDELNTQTHSPRHWFGLGITIVDSLDTLLIMGLNEEFQQGRQWVVNHLDMAQPHVSVSKQGMFPCLVARMGLS